jgi:hypothetical protein
MTLMYLLEMLRFKHKILLKDNNKFIWFIQTQKYFIY